MPIKPVLLKHINRLARRHVFLTEQSLTKYTTSQRRSYERDIYDYARAATLPKAQAKMAVVYARRLCGEEEYDSDNSSLDDDEVDDSALLRTSSVISGHNLLDRPLAATTDTANGLKFLAHRRHPSSGHMMISRALLRRGGRSMAS